MNHVAIIGVSIVAFFVVGSFSFDSAYGQIHADYRPCLGDLCNLFSNGGFYILMIVFGAGAFFLLYYLLGKKLVKKTSE